MLSVTAIAGKAGNSVEATMWQYSRWPADGSISKQLCRMRFRTVPYGEHPLWAWEIGGVAWERDKSLTCVSLTRVGSCDTKLSLPCHLKLAVFIKCENRNGHYKDHNMEPDLPPLPGQNLLRLWVVDEDVKQVLLLQDGQVCKAMRFNVSRAPVSSVLGRLEETEGEGKTTLLTSSQVCFVTIKI